MYHLIHLLLCASQSTWSFCSAGLIVPGLPSFCHSGLRKPSSWEAPYPGPWAQSLALIPCFPFLLYFRLLWEHVFQEFPRKEAMRNTYFCLYLSENIFILHSQLNCPVNSGLKMNFPWNLEGADSLSSRSQHCYYDLGFPFFSFFFSFAPLYVTYFSLPLQELLGSSLYPQIILANLGK